MLWAQSCNCLPDTLLQRAPGTMGIILSFLSEPGPKREGSKPSETSQGTVKAQQSSARRKQDPEWEPNAAPSTSSLLPAANPTTSFWLIPPSPIATHVSSETVPAQADVGAFPYLE